ncbi:DUF2970 domain-containing protein [Ottowia sp. GY511]|uniref:DUF2970 domain-containing protein n=1 Tax=Ottowia flava TaxID=2675430 RepID=A0ABW4KSH5_9BURK|nr:DUF2970 domain-containing protein [Ottowia sp. GY511]TXK32853.1 DUF2970 domain-containing protein [Ottowia sp. GY511]
MNAVRQPDPAREASPEVQPPSFWRSMRMVAWGLLGIRKRSEYQQDLAQVSPFHVVIAGLVALVLFIVVLLLIVNWVVASGPAAA